MTETVVQDEKDGYFLHFLKYEQCIYVIGIVGAISQMLACLVIIACLALHLDFGNDEITTRGITYSYMAIFVLTGTSFSEVLLLRAVNQRILRYIQWWMFSSFLLVIISVLLTVIIGFTIFEHGLWVTLAFVYIILRLPIQMYFVDHFAHAEILHREPHPQNQYATVLYRRMS